MYPKVFDLYNFCSDELKKSLDLGREFDSKIREEDDRIRVEGKKKDAEEAEKAEKETDEEKKARKLVGEAYKK